MIAFVFFVLIVGCALLGQLIPRFARRAWKRVTWRRNLLRRMAYYDMIHRKPGAFPNHGHARLWIYRLRSEFRA